MKKKTQQFSAKGNLRLMKENENRIVWEKWIHPEDNPDIKSDGWDDEEDISYEDKTEPDIRQVILGPASNIPMNPLLDEREYDFWMGHSNFKLDDDIIKIICESTGLESVDIVTPYRFRISVGRLFSPSRVTNGISKSIAEYFST